MFTRRYVSMATNFLRKYSNVSTTSMDTDMTVMN